MTSTTGPLVALTTNAVLGLVLSHLVDARLGFLVVVMGSMAVLIGVVAERRGRMMGARR